MNERLGNRTSLFRDFTRRLVKSWSAKLGLYLFLAIVLICFIGPFFCRYGKNDIDITAINAAPSREHLLGCGLVAGYFGGRTESVIMRVMDVWSALPGMMLCILVSAVLGSNFFSTVVALTVGGVPGFMPKPNTRTASPIWRRGRGSRTAIRRRAPGAR